MDQNTSRGIAAVRRIKNQHRLEGVYGTLAELMDVPEKFRTAVEVTAGNSLFHYVVDNDETATKVLEILQRDKLGRVTFMPLNRLKPRPANVPKAGDALPMIEKIQFDDIYRKAFEQVFGKTIICPNLAVAAQYARSHGVTAITPEGDRSDKKGALTGGFHDPRQSRIQAVKTVAKWRDEYEMHKQRQTNTKRGVERKDQEITRAVGELQKIEQRRQQLDASYGPLRLELRSKVAHLGKLRDNLDAKSNSRESVESSEKALGEQLSSYEAELKSEFKKALTRDEEQQLERLGSSVQDLRKQYSELSTSRTELEARKSVLEVELRENLHQRLDQLKAQEIESAESGGTSNLKDSQRELKRMNAALGAVERKLSETEEAIDRAAGQLAELEQSKSDKKKQQEEISRSIERHQKKMERSMAKKALLSEKAAECSRNIRDLGVLPEEAFEKYQNTNSNVVCTIVSTVIHLKC
jgi:structural maintenance of chromosome 3 (chondroitin sulfate proteoglycan 6)